MSIDTSALTDNSSQATWGDGTANSLSPVFSVFFGISAVCAILALAIFLYVRPRYLSRFRGFAASLVRLCELFFFGSAALLPLCGVGFGIWYASQHVSGGDALVAFRWLAIGLAAFLAIAGFGWLAERWTKRIRSEWRDQAESVTTEANE